MSDALFVAVVLLIAALIPVLGWGLVRLGRRIRRRASDPSAIGGGLMQGFGFMLCLSGVVIFIGLFIEVIGIV